MRGDRAAQPGGHVDGIDDGDGYIPDVRPRAPRCLVAREEPLGCQFLHRPRSPTHGPGDGVTEVDAPLSKALFEVGKHFGIPLSVQDGGLQRAAWARLSVFIRCG